MSYSSHTKHRQEHKDFHSHICAWCGMTFGDFDKDTCEKECYYHSSSLVTAYCCYECEQHHVHQLNGKDNDIAKASRRLLGNGVDA